MSIKQIGTRYRVRQDPYFHGFWCIVDRGYIDTFNVIAPYTWAQSRMGFYYHFRDEKDALEMVRLLEISDKVNGEG